MDGTSGGGSGDSKTRGKGGKGSKGGKGGGQQPAGFPPGPKQKKEKSLKSQVSSKIQSCNSKLTDVKIWIRKVEASVLPLSCVLVLFLLLAPKCYQ